MIPPALRRAFGGSADFAPAGGHMTPSTVHIVGAGPGDPELLTLKAHALLRRAEVVLHDELVAPAIIALAAKRAQIINVGKRCGEKKITQAQINRLMIDAARRSLVVVRLKSGDPGIFGRLAEEIAALETAGISYQVVPGVTAGIAAAASIGASLTDRRSSSSVMILTRHHAHEKAANSAGPTAARPGDWTGVARDDTTFVIYMPGHDLASLRRELLGAGFAPDFPAVIVSRASTPNQREWTTTLGALDQAPPLDPPTVLLLGRPLEPPVARASRAQLWECESLPAAAALLPL
jgi:uroporphyrin-III C-methyltransferase